MKEGKSGTRIFEVEERRLSFRRPSVPQRDRMGRDMLNSTDQRRPVIYRSVLTALAEDKDALNAVLDLPNGRALAGGIINEMTKVPLSWFGEMEIGPDYEKTGAVLIRGQSYGFRAPTDEEAMKAAQKLQLGDRYGAVRELVITCAEDVGAVENLIELTGPLTYGTIGFYILTEREPEMLNIRLASPD